MTVFFFHQPFNALCFYVFCCVTVVYIAIGFTVGLFLDFIVLNFPLLV